jgi:hypothetical protein
MLDLQSNHPCFTPAQPDTAAEAVAASRDFTKILVETIVLKGIAPLSGERFLPFAESIAGERIRLKNF